MRCLWLCPVVGVGRGAALEEAAHLLGVSGTTTVAGSGIPVQRDTTEMAPYPLIFLLAPLVNANLLLTADVFQTIAIVWYAAIALIDDEVAGQIRAIGTASDPRLTGSALCYLAPLKRYPGASFMQTTLAGDLFHRHIVLLT